MADKGTLLALGLLGIGGYYLLTQTSAASALGLSDPDLGPNPYLNPNLTPAQQAAIAANARTAGPGNAPASPATPFIGSPGGLSGVGAVVASTLPLLGLGATALAITTAGIGVAIAFLSYELLKQRASMHTNDVRDAWQRQFIALHSALGIRPLTIAQTQGSGPGSIEMAEVIFYFDHDNNQTLWKAVSHTQDERVFRAAAANVDRFLGAQGIPVQDVAA